MNLLDALAPNLWQLVLGRNDEPGGPMIRAAKASMCPRCDGHLIHGLDNDWGALDAHVDPWPLSALGEAQAVFAGLRTYDLSRHGGTFQLDGRDHGHIRGRPAGLGRGDVLAAHRCGLVLDRAPPVLVLHRPDPSADPGF